jgi:hypothetical protein
MPKLISQDGRHNVTVDLHRVVEDHLTPYVMARVRVQTDGDTHRDTAVTLTDGDVEGLLERMQRLKSVGDMVSFVNIDDDLRIDADVTADGGLMSVGLWLGEPADLMYGYRFLVDARQPARFSQALVDELRALMH